MNEVLNFPFCLHTGVECSVGVLIYWYQKRNVFSINARKFVLFPLDDGKMREGMYFTIVSSALYIVAVFVEILDILMEASRKEIKRSPAVNMRRILPQTRRKKVEVFDF